MGKKSPMQKLILARMRLYESIQLGWEGHDRERFTPDKLRELERLSKELEKMFLREKV